MNSQSGKGGVAYLLESEFGIELPKDMQREFGPIANDAVDRLGREVSAAELQGDVLARIRRAHRAVANCIHFHADGEDGVFECRATRRRATATQRRS